MLKQLTTLSLAFLIGLLPLIAIPKTALAATTPVVNLVLNPSMETATANVPANWHDGSWGTNTHTATYEADGHTGAHSLKTTVTSYTNGDDKWYFDDATVTPGVNYQYTNWYKSNIASEIDVQITDTAGVVTYQSLGSVAASPTAWTLATGTFVAPANAKSVTVYQVIAGVGYVQIDDASLTTYAPAQFNRAMVSLTFDDSWRSQYTAGLPILDKYVVKGTFYSLTGTFTDPQYMDELTLKKVFDDGQEIASHTVTHPHLPTLSLAQVDAELGNSKTTLQGLFGPTAAINFATPYGEYTGLQTEFAKYYRSHRSTDDGFNSKDNFDITNIKVQNILDDTKPAQVASWVAQAQADKTWLVLVYHEVKDDTAPTVEDYSVTAANLETEIAAMKASGITIETVNAALDEIAAQSGATTPPAPVTKTGDTNADGLVDALDLSNLLTNWNKTAATVAQGDNNADGVVDALDLSNLLINWSK